MISSCSYQFISFYFFGFSDKQIKGIEDHVPTYQSDVEWELDDYQRQRLEELGLIDKPKDDNDPYSLVARR